MSDDDDFVSEGYQLLRDVVQVALDTSVVRVEEVWFSLEMRQKLLGSAPNALHKTTNH